MRLLCKQALSSVVISLSAITRGQARKAAQAAAGAPSLQKGEAGDMAAKPSAQQEQRAAAKPQEQLSQQQGEGAAAPEGGVQKLSQSEQKLSTQAAAPEGGVQSAVQADPPVFEQLVHDPEWSQLLQECASKDAEYASVQQRVESGQLWDFALHDGLLYYHPSIDDHPRLYVPAGKARQRVLSFAHDSPLAGHVGRDKLLELVRRHFFWPSMAASVAEYVASCPQCQRNKPSNKKQPGPLQPLPIPDRCWDEVSMDLITKLPVTPQGHDCIVVFVDKLSKRVILVPATEKGLDVKQYANLFMQHVFRAFGMPRALISGRDTRFTSNLWGELCKRLGMGKKMR
jgi:putative transposase